MAVIGAVEKLQITLLAAGMRDWTRRGIVVWLVIEVSGLNGVLLRCDWMRS